MNHIQEFKFKTNQQIENYNLASKALQKLNTTIEEVDSKVEFINNSIEKYKGSNVCNFNNLSQILNFENLSQKIIEDFIKEKNRQYREIKKFIKLSDIIEDCKQELDDYYLSIGTRNPGNFNDNIIRNKNRNEFYSYGFCSHDEKLKGSKIDRISIGIYFQIIGDCYKKEKDIVYQMINRIEKLTELKAYAQHKCDPMKSEKDYPGRGMFRYAYTDQEKPTCIHVEFYFN